MVNMGLSIRMTKDDNFEFDRPKPSQLVSIAQPQPQLDIKI